jgi:hypothetical protein
MRRTSRRVVLGLCAGMSACVLLTACGGDGKKATTKQVDRARASGDNVQAHAAAALRKPEAVAIRVSAAPKQRVTVVWALSCNNGSGKDEKTSGGTYSVMTPNIRELKLPDSPRDVCQIDATTKLLLGRVKTTLLAKVP